MSEAHRILVVDDEPNIVDVISMALRFQDFEVESAGNGADAVAAVGSFKPHLIVLDVMLPDMEGFDVARRIGAQQARVPIIYLTARDAFGGIREPPERPLRWGHTTLTQGSQLSPR